jgi:hypothetical protein
MRGDEMLMPFIAFFLGDRSAERNEEVLDWVFSSREAERLSVAGLLLSFFEGDDTEDFRDKADPEAEGRG